MVGQKRSKAVAEAVVARELEFAWMRGVGICVVATGFAALCLLGGEIRWIHTLGILYQGFTSLVTYPFALGYARRSVRAIAEDPLGFAASHRYPRLPSSALHPPLLDEPGVWLSVPLLIAMSGIFAVAIRLSPGTTAASKDLGPVIFVLLLTGAANLLTESLVWLAQGRRVLYLRLGVNSLQVMADAGYRWHCLRGWVS